MLIRNHDPYSGHEPPRRDLEAEAQAALAEIIGGSEEPVPCVMCGQPESAHEGVGGHPYLDQRPGPQRKPPAKKATTKRRPARPRKAPQPPKATP